MTKKLKFMPYAQAEVRTTEDGTIILRSYFTDVIYLSLDGFLECTGTYSATTRKHISAFMREYTPYDYYTAKKCYEQNYKFNIYTGEIVSLERW